MKKLLSLYDAPRLFIYLNILALLQFSSTTIFETKDQTNAIIGNLALTDSEVSEKDRVQNHLRKVIEILRNSHPKELSSAQHARRQQLIEHLSEYALRAEFPINSYQIDRTPVFIDEQGNICAVGFLIEKTVGREVSEQINQQFQLDEVLAMKSEMVTSWCAENGLHEWEAAMVQPTYGYYVVEREQGKLSKGGTLASLATAATAVSVGGYQLLIEPRPKVKRWVSVIGLSAGMTSLIRGFHLRGQKDTFTPLPSDQILMATPARLTDNTGVRLIGTVSIANGIIITGLNTFALIRKTQNVKSARSFSVGAVPMRQGGVVSARLAF